MKRKSSKKSETFTYQHNINDVVLYAGKLYETYRNQKCIIKDRSRTHTKENYKVQFSDGIIHEITSIALKRIDAVVEGE